MKEVKTIIAALALAFATAQAGAVAYTPDDFLGSADLGNSGDATEEAALESILGFDVTMDDKVNDADAFAEQDENGNWYIDVDPNTPGYFLLKVGTGGLGAVDDTYFFENIAELTKLVWTNAQVSFVTGGCGADRCNIGRLSHYTSFNGTGDDGGDGGNDDGGNDDGGNDDSGDGGNDDGGTLPEPGSISLFGLALAGLALARRRRK